PTGLRRKLVACSLDTPCQIERGSAYLLSTIRNFPYSYGLQGNSWYAASVSTLSHLRQLEAEGIHIMREVVAECQRPVSLYSIGRDSSVLLRLAQKAFYPGTIPFPLLHIDTSYKFREMIEFRDRYTAQLGVKLI